MMVSKGQINTDRLILSTLISLVFIGGAYGLYNLTFTKAFIQIDTLIILFIYSGLVVFVFRRGVNELRTVDIYSDRICIKYLGIFSLTILFSDIINYNTFIIENNHFLQIRTPGRVLLINRTLLSNGKELIDKFNEFVHKREQHYNINNYKKRKNLETILFAFSGVLLTLMAILPFFSKESLIERKDLVVVKDYLNGSFEIHKPKLRNPGHRIFFNTMRFPMVTFNIGSPGYNSSDLTQLENYTSQDAIDMLISKSERDVKLLKTQNPSFMEKHFNWNTIYVYELRVNNKTIFTLEEYNTHSKTQSENNRIWSIVFGVIGIEIIRRAIINYL